MGGLQGAIHVVTDRLFCHVLLCPTLSRNCFFNMTRKQPPAHPYPLSLSED